MLHDLADEVASWREPGREMVLVRGVQTWGFGSRHRDEVLVVDDRGHTAGRIGGERASGRLRDEIGASMLGHAPCGACFVTAEISTLEAAHEGLTCGGTVRAIAQRVDGAPQLLWDALVEGRPVAVVTTAETTEAPPPWFVATAERSAGEAAALGPQAVIAGLARDRLAAGTPDRTVTDIDGRPLLVELFAPTPQLLVVGHGELADALADQGRLLGWVVSATDDLEPSLDQLQGFGTTDALVVLSHDGAVDAPVIRAALAHQVGYVGTLGSRRTQQARRDRLTELGVEPDQQATIFGPVGLDLGARTPQETALSVVAEIVAHRSGRSGVPLRSHDGPIHVQPMR